MALLFLRRSIGAWQAQLRVLGAHAALNLLEAAAPPPQHLGVALNRLPPAPDDAEETEDATGGLFDSLWNFAVPKTRTSHSRKRIRNMPKVLKVNTSWNYCKCCGKPTMPHRMWKSCVRAAEESVRAQKLVLAAAAAAKDDPQSR
ncbi:hypothetical protein M885DRAFT_626511 [Pelagophyceae sp. CCMP2097]|nr:hypothetical protein M885DRAFT_626511 [Pelagophyceae sp. CCMP2097]